MAYRATKSGLAADAQQKNEMKYDLAVATEVMEWISSSLKKAGDPTHVNTSPKQDDVFATLGNGHVLVRLMNVLEPPTKIPDKFTKAPVSAPFKIMEVVSKFTAAMSDYGVPNTDIFQTVDLTERQNLRQVIFSLDALSRNAMKRGHAGVGPKESTQNIRQFTDEQLKAGQGVIGLQMGTNKGANQSGMNIGNTRHIVD